MDTVLLAAAGKGKRFFGYEHPFGKGFIEIKNRSLVDYLLDEIQQFGTRKLVIAANKDNWQYFRKFEDRFNLHIYIDTEVRGNPYYWYALQERLPEQYFMVYCHQPVLSEHLSQMDRLSQTNSLGVTIYREYEESKKIHVKLNKHNVVSFEESSSLFIGSPWVIAGTPLAKLARDDGFAHWPGYYFRKAWEEGKTVFGTETEMPHEIDFDWQLPSLLKFIQKNLKDR